MIKEIKINGWNNKILDHGNVKYPQSNDLNAPKTILYLYLSVHVDLEKLFYYQNF